MRIESSRSCRSRLTRTNLSALWKLSISKEIWPQKFSGIGLQKAGLMIKKKKGRLLWFHFSSVESFWNHKNVMILFETVTWTEMLMLVHEFGFKSSSSKRGRLVSFKLIYIWCTKVKHIPWKMEALWINSNISTYSRLNQNLPASFLVSSQSRRVYLVWIW